MERKNKANIVPKPSGEKVSSFVQLKDINKIYPNGVQAVYDFNIDIDKNEFIVLVGPSGCGKSTTLRMIAGLEDITSGYLYIDQALSNYTPSKNRNISMVFQNYALYPQMTVYDNIAFPLRAKKYRKPIFAIELLAIKEAREIIEKRIEEYLLAKMEAGRKDINYTTKIEFIATKLCVSDQAVRLLGKFKIAKASDLDNPGKTKKTLREEILEDLLAKEEKEQEKVAKKGYELDGDFHYLKDGEMLYRERKLTEQEIRQSVFEAASILDLGPYLDRRPRELSGGQMQRVALGRAIVRNAKLFLMDEPLSNLDAKLRVAMRSEIVRIHEQIGATTIYVTHDQTEAMTMATKIVVMSKGWVQQIGTPEEIYNHPKNIFVATFIGAPAMNIFDAIYDNGSLVFGDGYKIALTPEEKKRHDTYFQEKIDDLKRLLATEDFIKLKAIKAIDEALFAPCFVSSAYLEKEISEMARLSASYPFAEKAVAIKSQLESNKETIIHQFNDLLLVNEEKKLKEISEIIVSLEDEHGLACKSQLETLLAALPAPKIERQEELLGLLSKIQELKEEAITNNANAVIGLFKHFDLGKLYRPSFKGNLLSLRKPLLTFEKISSTDLSKLHNAQVFNKAEAKQSEALYYQKPKGKPKKSKHHFNLNSKSIEFISNLYDVAENLLNRCTEALNGPHHLRVGIRPEDIHQEGTFSGKTSDAFEVESEIVELLGSELLVHFNWDNAKAVAKIATEHLVKPHSKIKLVFRRDKLLLFDEVSGDTI